MLACRLISRSVETSWASPSRIASPARILIPASSGTQRNVGMAKTANQSATMGPTMRMCSACILVEPEQRALGLDEQDQQQPEAGEPPHIAEAPAPARQPPDAVFGHQPRKHRVVEHVADLERRVGDDEKGQRPQHVRRVGARVPEERGRHDRDRHEDAEPGLAPAGAVGDRAQDRAEHRYQNARHRESVAPRGGPLDRVVGHGAREIGREHEGDDDGGEARIRPVVEAPGELRPLARDWNGDLRGRGHGRRLAPFPAAVARYVADEALHAGSAKNGVYA